MTTKEHDHRYYPIGFFKNEDTDSEWIIVKFCCLVDNCDIVWFSEMKYEMI